MRRNALVFRVWAMAATVVLAANQGAATEPNETFADATLLSPGALSVADELFGGTREAPDTLLGSRGLFGGIETVDDDGSIYGNGLASGFSGVPVNAGGEIRFSVTGHGDLFFDGDHAESGQYAAYVEVYDLFDELADEFSVDGFLQPGESNDYSFSDFKWLSGSYSVQIDNEVGGVVGGDIDFFTFTGLAPGAAFSAETRSLSSIDTLLGWFGATGDLLALDDESGSGALSLIAGVVPSEGRLTFAVTGSGDDSFLGAHVETNDYELRLTLASAAFAADFDRDGDVDGADLARWEEAFAVNSLGDADADNDSDGADFMRWQIESGSSVGARPELNVAPEPSAGPLALVGLLVAGGSFSTRRTRTL